MHLLQSSHYFKGRQWFGVAGSHKGDGWVGRGAGQAKLKPLAGVCLDSVLLVSARNTCPPEIQTLRRSRSPKEGARILVNEVDHN
jgi:hypothetical protein